MQSPSVDQPGREPASLALLAAILENIAAAFYVLDPHWCFSYVNRKGAELLGRSRDELLGKNIWTEFPSAGYGSGLQLDTGGSDAGHQQQGRADVHRSGDSSFAVLWFHALPASRVSFLRLT
jgi:PAS domain S-box-containing protein